MKTLIFGRGYIGTQIAESKAFSDSVLSAADITKFSAINTEIEKHKPELIINAAGKTNLEWCRDNKVDTLLINIAGPLNVLKACADKNLAFVHLSSGCVFEGAGKDGQGFTEDDLPTPACFYAYTKAMSDALQVSSGYDKLLILRLRQPFGLSPHPRSIITKILNFDKALDSQQSMTFIPDLIEATKLLLEKNLYGIFNIANEGTLSPYDIALIANKMNKLSKNFTRIDKSELDKLDKQAGRERRVDTLVNIKKLKSTGFQMPPLKQRIEEALAQYDDTNLDSSGVFSHK